MLKHPQITSDRIKQFVQRELKSRAVLESAECGVEIDLGEGWRAVAPGFKWGPAYRRARYRVTGEIPDGWQGLEVGLAANKPNALPADGWPADETVEGLLYQEGVVVGALDWAHPYHRVSEKCPGAGRVVLEIETYARNLETTVHGREKPRTLKPETVRPFYLVAVDRDLVQLYYDVHFAQKLVEALDEAGPHRAIVLRALNDVCNLFTPGSRKSVAACRRSLKTTLESLADEAAHTVTALGHAHLDTAWLWPLDVTRLKMAHTTALQLNLIERFPEHVFVHSQASQYEWLEQDHPALFARVKAAVAKGAWEPVGSMWVEADCNLAGGESLVRQFLYGRRYFQEKLGVETRDMWLPDVFGYSAAIPQILVKFGIQAFLTQKLSWNQFNKIPHNTFWWQGIDGSRVWTHFPPADTYCANCEPKEIVESVKKYRDHGRCDRSAYVFGFGDGGGGPTEQHLEFLRRAQNAPGLPAIERRVKASRFFEKAAEESHDLMTWVGELYFELHRGTYTSQAADKRANRELEFLLRDAEWLSSFCPDHPNGYPQEELERAWKLVLLNQFHDIIPGSSVREVYQDSARDYAIARQIGERIVADRLAWLGNKLDREGMTRPVALFHNSVLPSQAELPWQEEEAPAALRTAGEKLPVQVVDDFGDRKLIFSAPFEASGAVTVGDLVDSPPHFYPRLKAASRRLENSELSVKFDGNGNIVSIQTLDDEPIEFVAPGKLANVFQLFDDHPLFWDAWDVDVFALETGRDLLKSESFEVVERGPVRAAVELTKRFGSSFLRQKVSLGPTPGIRFDTWIDWQEDEKMLKVAFPLFVLSPTAKFEIQFGHVDRPTHRNTSWDVARFEVCAQKWADLSQADYGAAVINTGKYGHDVLGDTLRLTLLRSPKAPDPTCDMGVHRFTYVLLPHYGSLNQSDVVHSAYAVNAPVRVLPLQPGVGARAELPRLVSCDDRNVVVETVKRAEDSDRLVVRLYECHGTRGRAALHGALPARRAWLADLNERPTKTLDVVEGAVVFPFGPFEIVTILLEL
jgi:alpha-mannosidase